MIDVSRVLAAFPRTETFCSVSTLSTLCAELQGDPRFEVRVAGLSRNGAPIHHVKSGAGRVKALLVASPHCMEPIGSVTVYGLLKLLQSDHPDLREADVEWHIVPCIDPDGAVLNEGWTQKPFDFATYMKHYYVEPSGEQVDMTFPIRYKRFTWDKPSHEAAILKSILDEVAPDFYFTLHNTRSGGAFFYVSRDVGADCYDKLSQLMRAEQFPVQTRPLWEEVCVSFAPGVIEDFKLRRYYDFLEQRGDDPTQEELLKYGVPSWEYLEETHPETLRFCAEMGYVLHPMAESEIDTGRNFRQFLLRLDTDNKYLASLLLEEWDRVEPDVDRDSPFYAAVASGWVLPSRDRLAEGGFPVTRYPTREILFGDRYNRTMTEADLFKACMIESGFFYHLYAYPFVRLLRASPQTPKVVSALERLERAFDDAHAELQRHVDFNRFEVVDCTRLGRIQFGSGLVVLNSLLSPGRPAGS